MCSYINITHIHTVRKPKPHGEVMYYSPSWAQSLKYLRSVPSLHVFAAPSCSSHPHSILPSWGSKYYGKETWYHYCDLPEFLFHRIHEHKKTVFSDTTTKIVCYQAIDNWNIYMHKLHIYKNFLFRKHREITL